MSLSSPSSSSTSFSSPSSSSRFNPLRTVNDINEKDPFTSFSEIQDKVSDLLLTQDGSKFLQKVLDLLHDKKANSQDDVDHLQVCIDKILSQINKDLVSLSKNQFANFLVSKLIHYSNSSQLALISSSLSPSLLEISCSSCGNYVVQHLIETAKDVKESQQPIINYFMQKMILILNDRYCYYIYIYIFYN
jgi:hypothetical protein